jgi:rubrerythrin
MAIFDITEVFLFAVRIEENGERFYRHAAAIAEDEAARYLFNYLADEEVTHMDTFKHIAAGLDILQANSPEQAETYPGEYVAYLRNYIDNKVVFSKDLQAQISPITNTLAALRFAIDRETDSILYYSEIKDLVPKSEQSLVNKIIEQERKHFTKLTEFKEDWERNIKS